MRSAATFMTSVQFISLVYYFSCCLVMAGMANRSLAIHYLHISHSYIYSVGCEDLSFLYSVYTTCVIPGSAKLWYKQAGVFWENSRVFNCLIPVLANDWEYVTFSWALASPVVCWKMRIKFSQDTFQRLNWKVASVHQQIFQMKRVTSDALRNRR